MHHKKTTFCLAWGGWASLVAACASFGACNVVAELLCPRLLLPTICWGPGLGVCHSSSTGDSGGTLLCLLLLPHLQLCKPQASKGLQACTVEPLGEQLALSALCVQTRSGPASYRAPLQPENASLHPTIP